MMSSLVIIVIRKKFLQAVRLECPNSYSRVTDETKLNKKIKKWLMVTV